MGEKTDRLERFFTDAISISLEIRFTEEKLLEAFSKGKIRGTIHTCIGQEFTASTLCQFLNLGSDWVLGNHRSHGHRTVR